MGAHDGILSCGRLLNLGKPPGQTREVSVVPKSRKNK